MFRKNSTATTIVSARQVPLDDVRAALRLRREAHAAHAGVATRVHEDQPDERRREQHVDDGEDGSMRAECSSAAISRGGVEDRAHEVAGDLILGHVAAAPAERARAMSSARRSP